MNNYHPLPEWRPQDACLIVWPHSHSDWEPRLDQISEIYVDIARSISDTQTVIIVYFDDRHKQYIQKLCINAHCNMQALKFIEIKTNDTWVRDFGPQFLFSGKEFKYLDMEFHAWGKQYDYQLDNQFGKHLFKIFNPSAGKYTDVRFAIEGGNLDFNGRGALLTNLTSIRKNNPGENYNDKYLTERLISLFGINELIAIDVDGLQGDDTHGHIDTLARFISDDLIVYASTNNSHNPNHGCLKDLESQLNDCQANRYQLLPIQLPDKTISDDNGQILPASYINFVFTNESLLVPIYNDDKDDVALDTFKELCPDREVTGINASELIRQYGSLHCATLHIPKNTIDENWYRSAK